MRSAAERFGRSTLAAAHGKTWKKGRSACVAERPFLPVRTARCLRRGRYAVRPSKALCIKRFPEESRLPAVVRRDLAEDGAEVRGLVEKPAGGRICRPCPATVQNVA